MNSEQKMKWYGPKQIGVIIFTGLVMLLSVAIVGGSTNTVIPAIAAAKGWDSNIMILFAGIGTILDGIGIFFFAKLARRSATRLGGIAMIVCAVCLAIYGTTDSLAMFLIMTLLMGICSAAFCNTAVMTLTANWWPTKKGIVLGWSTMGIVLCNIIYTPLIVSYFLIREMDPSEVGEDAKQTVAVKDLLKSLFSNKYAILLLIITVIQFVSVGVTQLGGTYYFAYFMGNPNMLSPVMLISLIPLAIAMIVMPIFMGRQPRMYGISMTIAGVWLILCYLICGPNNAGLTMVMLGISVILTTACLPMCVGALTPMVIDYGEWHSGTRADGLISSIANFANKVGLALGAALLGGVLGAAGFMEGGVAQTPEAVSAIHSGYLLLPGCILLVDAVIFFVFFRLSNQIRQIQAELAERHKVEIAEVVSEVVGE